MNWHTRRKLLYTLGILILIIIFLLYTFRASLSPMATCFDGKQNGDETGNDCGGSCSLMCKEDVLPLTVEWSSFIKTQDNVYDLVALVSNKNIISDAPSTSYIFDLVNKDGKVIFENKGKLLAPINTDFPIILQNVKVSDIPTKLLVSVSSDNNYKTTLNGNTQLVKVLSKTFQDGSDIRRLYVTIANNTLDTLKNIKVDTILFDENRNAVGVGETFIDSLDGDGSKQLVYTWNTPFSKTPVVIEVYPFINPFTLNK